MLLKDHFRPVGNFHYVTTSMEDIRSVECSHFSRASILAPLSENKRPLPHSQETFNGHYAVPEESELHSPSLFPGDHFNILLPPTRGSFGVTRKFNRLLPVTYL